MSETTTACKMCGKCCRWLLIAIMGIKDVDVDFVEARGLAVVRVGEDGVALYAKNNPCQYLRADNTCAIYENRPDSCKRYPEDRLVILPECGYGD